MFSQANGVFHFPKYNVDMKFGLAQLVIDWMQTPSTSSILYDYKFVHLMMTMIIGKQNISRNTIDPKKMAFIKGKTPWIILVPMVILIKYGYFLFKVHSIYALVRIHIGN